MILYLEKKRFTLSYRILRAFIAFSFIFSLILPPGYAQLIPQTILNLPAPGTMVTPSAAFTPALINGITIHPENPLEFNFIVGTGDDKLQGKAFEEESTKLIKYFLASLTVPEDEMWVNLSPYEKDRVIPEGFGTTEMGRDLLAQDYILKQLTASLMYPEKELGSEFWKKIYQKAYEEYGTTEIPVDTFNKVWIVPEKAVVYEHGNSAFVVKSRLKVMLEQDYAMQKVDSRSSMLDTRGPSSIEHQTSSIEAEIIHEILLPEIEREVNEGKSFANLRQIYNSAILAAWFKQNLKGTLIGQVYVDKAKTKGIDVEDKTVNQKIYDQYLAAFKKGVYNYIKEDYDPATQEIIPRKYFSGGTNLKVGDLVETYRKELSLTRPQQEVVGEYLDGLKDYNQGMVRVNLVELSEDMSVAEAWKLIQESQVEKVKEDVLAGIKKAKGLLETLSAETNDGLVPSGVNVLKYTLLLNALKAASWKDTGERKKRKEERVPAASLFNIIEEKDLGSRIQNMIATLNSNTNTSEKDKQEITSALNSLQKSLEEFKSFGDIIFQEASLDEQLKKVSHAFNLPEVNIFYALRNAVNQERLTQELSGILGVTPGDELKKRMTAANMIYRAGDTYILWPDFLTSPKLKKITSGISKDLLGTVEKAILDSVDVNNFVAALAWDSRKSEEDIVEFLKGQKRLSSLAERWRAFHAQESDEAELREAVERAQGIAGDFIKGHPAESSEFVLAVRVAPNRKSAVVTTAIQSSSGNNERASRILLLDLSKGDAGVKVLDEANKTQYNSPFNQMTFFNNGEAVTVWNLSRQRKWDIRDLENPRPIGWQEEETWVRETSSSPATARVAEIRGLLQEIDKERQTPGSGNLPQVAVISDVHGAAELFFKYTADAISRNIGRPVVLEDKKFPKVSIKEQLEAQGIDIKEITLKFNLLGDWEDRGPYGVKVHLAGIELDELGLVVDAGMVQGNHDEWMGNNLKGLHLPLRKGHNYRGHEEIRRLVEEVHWNDPEIAKDRFGWWAARLKEYNVSQKDLQENGTLVIGGERLKVSDIRREIKDEIYPTLKERADVTAEQKKFIEELMGFSYGMDVFTGFNDIGMMPVEWWQERYERVKEYAQAARETEKGYGIDIGTELKRHTWEDLEKYTQEAARIVRERFNQAIQDGKWEWAFFNDQNKWNYESPEWWAKDWLYHSNWGESVLKELNELEEGGIVWDETNYMKNPYLQRIVSYKQTRYNLFQRDPYGFLSTHGWIPVDRKTAKMGFSYKGIKYEGDKVWEGLEVIEKDRSNPALSLEEIYEGIELVNGWYSDKMTEIKPDHVAYNVKTLGLETIFKTNGIGHVWFTGHNPQNKLVDQGLPGFKSQQGEYAFITADKGMSYQKYNDLGGYVLIDAKGIRMRGFSGTDFQEIVDNPPTFKLKKDGEGEYVIGKKWENEAIEREDFLNIAEKQLKEELTRLQATSSPLSKEEGARRIDNLFDVLREMGGFRVPEVVVRWIEAAGIDFARYAEGGKIYDNESFNAGENISLWLGGSRAVVMTKDNLQTITRDLIERDPDTAGNFLEEMEAAVAHFQTRALIRDRIDSLVEQQEELMQKIEGTREVIAGIDEEIREKESKIEELSPKEREELQTKKEDWNKAFAGMSGLVADFRSTEKELAELREKSAPVSSPVTGKSQGDVSGWVREWAEKTRQEDEKTWGELKRLFEGTLAGMIGEDIKAVKTILEGSDHPLETALAHFEEDILRTKERTEWTHLVRGRFMSAPGVLSLLTGAGYFEARRGAAKLLQEDNTTSHEPASSPVEQDPLRQMYEQFEEFFEEKGYSVARDPKRKYGLIELPSLSIRFETGQLGTKILTFMKEVGGPTSSIYFFENMIIVSIEDWGADLKYMRKYLFAPGYPNADGPNPLINFGIDKGNRIHVILNERFMKKLISDLENYKGEALHLEDLPISVIAENNAAVENLKIIASSPAEVAVNLDAGARLQTSLNRDLLSKLWSPSDTRRRHYQAAQDYKIVKTEGDQLKLVDAERGTMTKTPLSDVDDALGILDRIKELDALRKKEGEPQRIIRVLDWGAGEGVALIALKKWLNEAAISNVELIGYSDIYYLGWHNAPEGITFIFDVVENLIERLKGKKIDLIYSRFGMYHYTSEAFDREEVVQHFSDLGEVLSSAGEIRSDFFYLLDSEVAASNFTIMPIAGKMGAKMYPLQELKGNGEDVEFRSDEIQDASNAPGGIDLNPALLDLQIKRDGNGVPLPLPQQPLENMHIEGFLPIIINITPVTNLPLLLGLADTKQDTEETIPAMKAREPEEVSYLN